MYETEKPTPTNPIYHQFFGSFQTFSDAEDGEDGKRTRVTHQTSTSGRRAIFEFGFTALLAGAGHPRSNIAAGRRAYLAPRIAELKYDIGMIAKAEHW